MFYFAHLENYFLICAYVFVCLCVRARVSVICSSCSSFSSRTPTCSSLCSCSRGCPSPPSCSSCSRHSSSSPRRRRASKVRTATNHTTPHHIAPLRSKSTEDLQKDRYAKDMLTSDRYAKDMRTLKCIALKILYVTMTNMYSDSVLQCTHTVILPPPLSFTCVNSV